MCSGAVLRVNGGDPIRLRSAEIRLADPAFELHLCALFCIDRGWLTFGEWMAYCRTTGIPTR